ncbi:MAG: DsbA family protein, partial [Proteobacteria bacterium]
DLKMMVERVFAQKPVTISPPAGSSTFGNPNAKITITEFSDFQCPYCKRGAVLLNTLINRYPNEIKVVFLNFPLDQSCHRQIERPMHPFSCQLARGGACAEKSGRFKEYYEGIFENQPSLTGESALQGLTKTGVTQANAQACLDSEEAKKLISAQIEIGIQNNIQGTPAFFINGYKIDSLLPLEAWDQMIERLKKN